MNYQTNTYKSNDDLDDPNPGSLLAENTPTRRKSSTYSLSYLDPFKDCSPSPCSSLIHGPREDGSGSRSSLKRSLENNDDDIKLKKQKTLGTRVETEQSIEIEKSNSETKEQLTVLQKTNAILMTEQTGKRTLRKQVSVDSKMPKIDKTSPVKNLEHFRQFMMRKGTQRPSQRVLEEFTLLKMCETIYQHNQEMLRQLRIKDMAFESLRAKYTILQKQITDIGIVQTRMSNDMRNVKESRNVVPVKITRSVGLQVNIQPLKLKINLPQQVPHAPDPLDPITVSGPLKKKLKRASPATDKVSILSPPPSALTPASAPITPPLGPTDNGIKTNLPKISNNGQTRGESNSLFGNILQKSLTTRTSAATTSLRRPSDVYVKVIDLTDADGLNRTSTGPGIQSTSGNIRVVTDLSGEDNSNRVSTSPGTQLSSGYIRAGASHQLTNLHPEAATPLVATNMPIARSAS